MDGPTTDKECFGIGAAGADSKKGGEKTQNLPARPARKSGEGGLWAACPAPLPPTNLVLTMYFQRWPRSKHCHVVHGSLFASSISPQACGRFSLPSTNLAHSSHGFQHRTSFRASARPGKPLATHRPKPHQHRHLRMCAPVPNPSARLLHLLCTSHHPADLPTTEPSETIHANLQILRPTHWSHRNYRNHLVYCRWTGHEQRWSRSN